MCSSDLITESPSFDEALSIEKKAYVDMIMKLALSEQPNFTDGWPWDTTTSASVRFRKMIIFVQRMLVKHITEGDYNPGLIIDFFRSDYFSATPYIHIRALIEVALAREMGKQKEARKAKPSDRLDKEIISHYPPYCDAIFIDRAFQYLLSDVLEFDQEYSVDIFSMKDKERFLSFVEGFL